MEGEIWNLLDEVHSPVILTCAAANSIPALETEFLFLCFKFAFFA